MTTVHFLHAVTDLTFVTMYYLVIGFVVSLVLNHVIEILDTRNYKDLPTWQLGLEIAAHTLVLSIAFYVIRNVVRRIPYPFDGAGGYQHQMLYELDGGIVFSFLILFFQRNLIEKISIFQNRVRTALGYTEVVAE
jgi:hypothetical protein